MDKSDDTNTELAASKRKKVSAMLADGSVFVHVDARLDDVLVPPHLKEDFRLCLQFGMDLAVRIPDLEVGEEALRGTLSFSRRPFFCHVPWHAVFAVSDGAGGGLAWPESFPPELRRELIRAMNSDEEQQLPVRFESVKLSGAPTQEEADELRSAPRLAPEAAEPGPAPFEGARLRPPLRAVRPSVADDGEESEQAAGRDDDTRPEIRRGHLRLIR